MVFTAMAWMRSFNRMYSSEQRSESWAMQYLEIWKKSVHKRRLTTGMPAEVGVWCLKRQVKKMLLREESDQPCHILLQRVRVENATK